MMLHACVNVYISLDHMNDHEVNGFDTVKLSHPRPFN